MAIKKVSNEFMAKVLNDVAWKALSNTSNEILFHEECIEHFKNYWDWSELSSNTDLKLNYYLIDKFIDLWDWSEIINRYYDDASTSSFCPLTNISFDYIGIAIRYIISF